METMNSSLNLWTHHSHLDRCSKTAAQSKMKELAFVRYDDVMLHCCKTMCS